ncbi:MAG: lipoyl(octanoyl) transferase LipB [Gammaproteobacteria bacterium]|nr:lipoyl(octanoyl) transferase LipB [Gammaproteobacteria bacterium]MDP2347187.1 lipoyl(octanoyl) transferase LipB [Gammaproteobacteria bacterium]
MTPADSRAHIDTGDSAFSQHHFAENLDKGTLVVRSAALNTSLDYIPVWEAMRRFTENRNSETPDEVWLLTHLPVFTQGQAGKPEHLLNPGDIPVVQIDRGGQVTYHGPGQLVVYIMVDVRRAGTGARALVETIEQSVIAVLAEYGIVAESQRKAPGVYVKGAKIAALGLRIRQGCSYHGLSFNIDMDLSPFRRINPCGYEGMQVTQLRDLVPPPGPGLMNEAAERLLRILTVTLGYTKTSTAALTFQTTAMMAARQ